MNNNHHEEYVKKEVYEAELDHIFTLIENTEKRIDALNQSISRQFAFWGILTALTAIIFAGVNLGLIFLLK